MIYFVVAQHDETGEWHTFGPWEYIEGADTKITELTENSMYSQVEIARVLSDEDEPGWSKYDKHKQS